jgi:hypothetical protein
MQIAEYETCEHALRVGSFERIATLIKSHPRLSGTGLTFCTLIDRRRIQ